MPEMNYNMVKPNHLKVECESCNETVSPDPPARRLLFIIGFMAILGGVGFVMGTAIGVATAGTGIAATIPLGLIGLYAGYKTGGTVAEFLDGYSCPECNHVFSAPSVLTRAISIIR
jgi:hypothetical protein